MTDASWIEDAATALERLKPPHQRKKRNTVIALVDARIAGKAEETVWKLSGTCSRTVYHTNWKHDLEFSSVLKDVTAIAQRWQDMRALEALQAGAAKMALASPAAADKLIELLENADAAIGLRAATAILDRAGMKTATKQSMMTEHAISPELLSALNRVYGGKPIDEAGGKPIDEAGGKPIDEAGGDE